MLSNNMLNIGSVLKDFPEKNILKDTCTLQKGITGYRVECSGVPIVKKCHNICVYIFISNSFTCL